MALHPNWADLYEAITALDPTAEAIVQGDRRITWGEFDDTASRLAAVFTGGASSPGARVALYLYNGPEYLELAYGAFKARVVPINVNFRYRAAEVRHVLGDSGADVLVFHGALAERVAELDADERPAHLVQIDDGDAPLLDGAEWYHDLIAGASPAAPIDREGDDLLILYTGGTTGMPKGVVWRHGDLFQTLSYPAYVAAGMETPTTSRRRRRGDGRTLRAAGASPVMISAPPLIHGTALFLAMAALLRGGTVVLLAGRRFDAGELWQLVEAQRVTDIAIVGDPFARPMVAALEQREAGRFARRPLQRAHRVELGHHVGPRLQGRAAGTGPDGAARHAGRQRGRPVRHQHDAARARNRRRRRRSRSPTVAVLLDEDGSDHPARRRPHRRARLQGRGAASGTSTTRRRRRRCSGRSAASATSCPVTTPGSPPTGRCRSSGGARCASTPAARRCTRRRSRRR